MRITDWAILIDRDPVDWSVHAAVVRGGKYDPDAVTILQQQTFGPLDTASDLLKWALRVLSSERVFTLR